MAKIILGKRPAHFKRTLKIQLPEGTEGSIELQYVYRTRSEFGAFVDSMVAEAKVAPPASAAEEDVAFSLQAALEKMRDANAEYIMQIASGWNLDEPFELAEVTQMCNELPGVALAIINDYRAAMTEGRLGN